MDTYYVNNEYITPLTDPTKHWQDNDIQRHVMIYKDAQRQYKEAKSGQI